MLQLKVYYIFLLLDQLKHKGQNYFFVNECSELLF